MNILITGASGFIGSHLVPHLISQGHNVHPLSRQNNSSKYSNYESIVTSLAKNSDAIIHLAGIAHRTGTASLDYEKHNFILTKILANIAQDNRLKHFLFLSTAKVHGEVSLTPFNSNSAFNPKDSYSESKVNAETYLASLKSDTQFTSIRPPVVYGKNPKANIARLKSRITEGKIIPIPKIPNTRSFVSINNLVEAINHILNADHNRYNAYLVDDRQPVSTEQFITHLGDCLGITPNLVKIPNSIFQSADIVLSKTLNINSLSPLYKNFEIQCDLLEKQTNWQPIENLQSGLKQMVMLNS